MQNREFAYSGEALAGRLSLLPTIPFDILEGVLSYLEPQDLLSLSTVHGTWQAVLAKPECKVLWSHSRKAFGVPEPPENFTEQRWACLLFKDLCETCGEQVAPDVDWLLLKRICTECRKAHLASETVFAATDPEESNILSYVPHTYRNTCVPTGDGFLGICDRFYWDSDVECSRHRVNSLQGEELEQWKLRTIKNIQNRSNRMATYLKWAADRASSTTHLNATTTLL